MKQNQRGFTLIELLIAVMIIAILAAFAYPSYQESVRKNARSVAKTELLKVLARQETYFINSKVYATDLTSLGYASNGFLVRRNGETAASAADAVYRIELASGASATSFVLNAIPQNAQTKDSACATLSLDNNGTQSATGSLGSSCW